MNFSKASFCRSSLSLILLTGTSLAAIAQYPGSSPVPAEFKSGFDSITQAQCRKYLEFLATQCEGRGSGQPGFQKAADYVAARFKEYGLKPVGDNGTYFQSMDYTRSRLKPNGTVVAAGSFTASAGKGFAASASKDFDLMGSAVFIKLTDSSAKLPESLDLKDKIVVLSSSVPRASNRFYVAGAAAVITVEKNAVENTWTVRRPSPISSTARPQPSPRISGQIELSKAQAMASALNVDPNIVDSSVVAEGGFAMKAAIDSIHFKGVIEEETVKVPNVVGLLEGSDPTLKSEMVGLGAHLDHLGIRGGVVYPGADDDGSGTTSVLAIARAFSLNPQKPKRSILFMEFCGEEMGLVGSGYYSDHPIFPHEKMICELQMDMVGRNEEKPDEKASDNLDTIHLVGSKRISQELDDLVNSVNKYINFKFEYDEEAVYTRSDHYNFAKKGIPIAFLFSGFHPDYHQPTDTIEKINFEKLSNAAKLYYLVANLAANKEGPFKRNPAGGGQEN